MTGYEPEHGQTITQTLSYGRERPQQEESLIDSSGSNNESGGTNSGSSSPTNPGHGSSNGETGK